MKRWGIAGVFSLLIVSVVAQDKTVAKAEVRWMTFEQAVEKSKAAKRPIFIDVFTSWCGWCKVMDRETFNDPLVAAQLNDKFYPVKLDAEQREDITFRGTTYKFVASGSSGYHQLAAALLQNQLSYPTVVFLDEDFNMLQPLPGYRKAPEFYPIAKFIGDGVYKTQKWEAYQAAFKSPYNP